MLLLLGVSSALAASGDEGGMSATALGLLMIVVGAAIALFSGARAAQQGERLGMKAGDSGVQTFQLLYVLMGVVILVMGILTVTGIFVPAPLR